MKESDWNSKVKRTVKQLSYWTLAWVLSMALASFGPKYIWHNTTSLTMVCILLNLGLGIGMIYANIKHLKTLDELQQKIQMDAMGIALGIGIVGGLSYNLLDTTNIIANNAEISTLVMGMAISYLIAILVGHKTYK